MDLIHFLFQKKKGGRDINSVLGYLDMTKLIAFDTSEEMLEPVIATSYDFCLLQGNAFCHFL